MNLRLWIFLTGTISLFLLSSFTSSGRVQSSQSVASSVTKVITGEPSPTLLTASAKQTTSAEKSGNNQTTQTPLNCSTSGSLYTCQVLSTVGWQDSPFTVQVGQTVRIQENYGSWTVDTSSAPYVGADGYDPETDSAIASSCKIDAASPYAKLLGQVGSGSIFPIGGTLTVITSDTSGPLYLHINDQDACLGDNDGWIVVSILYESGFSCDNVTEIPVGECEGLVAVYNSTNGPGWTNRDGWLQTLTPCSWFGVSCVQDHVVILELSNNQLVGSIPSQLGDFSHLVQIDFNFNKLSGAIPGELGNLTNLDILYLIGNQLGGSIPPTLGNLTNLTTLALDNNLINGTIPPEIGYLTKLIGFGVSGNQISGTIPSQLSDLTNLSHLNLNNNQMTGSVPAELSSLVNLQSLSLNDNQFGGALPTRFVNLTKLASFSFNNTDLCEPPDTNFQSWLLGIPNLSRTNIVCATPSDEFREDFSSDPNTNGHWRFYRRGTLSGEWDPQAENMILTQDELRRVVAMFADFELNAKGWEVSFRYRAGGQRYSYCGDSGGDGFVFMFYKEEGDYYPPIGAAIGFNGQGYGIEFDNYYNYAGSPCDSTNDPSPRHIALIGGSAANHLAYVNDDRVEDNVWHSVKVTFAFGNVTVEVDGGVVLTYQIQDPDYTFKGIGFSSSTGLASNEHIIDDFTLNSIVTPTYSISGRVIDSSGNCTQDVTITTDDGNSALTDSDGHYIISDLAAGSYMLTASKSGCTFSTSPLVIVPPDATGQDFVVTTTTTDTTPPAATTSMFSIPDLLYPGQVKLSWTAPGDDGLGGGQARQYDMRYSGSPINTSNWDSAIPISRVPSPASPGSKQQMFVSNLPSGTRWYFAMKTSDEAGNISDLSNTPSVIDSGFRPNPSGYNFANGYPGKDDYTLADMRKMFGDQAVCRTFARGRCVAKSIANKWLAVVNENMKESHCLGMAISSLRFFTGKDNPTAFQKNASTVYDLTLTNARKNIAYYMVEQWIESVQQDMVSAAQVSLRDAVDQLYLGLTGQITNPPTLGIAKSNTNSHAVTPFTVSDTGSGTYTIWVYDNNWPDIASRTVNIDLLTNSWSYNFRTNSTPELWTGTEQDHRLGVFSLSLYPRTFPDFLPSKNSVQVTLAGRSHLLITDSQTRQIGYIFGDQFINEIPDASVLPVIGGLGTPIEPIYIIPSNDNYTILIDGQTLAHSDTAELTQYGSEYIVSVEDIMLTSASKDQLTIAMDGKQLRYNANETRTVTFTVALENTNEGYQFEIQGADIGAGEQVEMAIDTNQGRLAFSNKDANSGAYNLLIDLTDTVGLQTFVHNNLSISTGDTHYVDYASWDGVGSINLDIDYGSDGSIDQTLILSNQTPRYFLPVISR